MPKLQPNGQAKKIPSYPKSFPKMKAPTTLTTRSTDVPKVKPSMSVEPFRIPSRGIFTAMKAKNGTTQLINNLPELIISSTFASSLSDRKISTQNSLKGRIMIVANTQKIRHSRNVEKYPSASLPCFRAPTF